MQLWFDVEKKTITTMKLVGDEIRKLWFDVEKKTITTSFLCFFLCHCCGLM